MKKDKQISIKQKSLSDIHRDNRLPMPAHPLISLIDWTAHHVPDHNFPGSMVSNFYRINFNNGVSGSAKYGQGLYDFSEGGMTFVLPNQLMGSCSYDVADNWSIYTLLIHPDFLWNFPLAKKIKQYGFFSYNTNEALHLSEKEKVVILSLFKNIEDELNSRIDDESQEVIVAQVELLLNYANRFYKRQFITRKSLNSDLLQKIEDILEDYFISNKTLTEGTPTVHYLSEQMNLSPSYLSDMIRSLTGHNAQSLIHQKIVEKAKEKLTITDLSVSEVAYDLGFGHASSFTKLFKAKTKLSPLEFRKTFN